MSTLPQPADSSRPSFNDPSWNISEQMHGWIKTRFKWIWRNLKKTFQLQFSNTVTRIRYHAICLFIFLLWIIGALNWGVIIWSLMDRNTIEFHPVSQFLNRKSWFSLTIRVIHKLDLKASYFKISFNIFSISLLNFGSPNSQQTPTRSQQGLRLSAGLSQHSIVGLKFKCKIKFIFLSEIMMKFIDKIY